MRDTIEQLQKEEQELEKQMLGTPEPEATTPDTTTTPSDAPNATPTPVGESVTPQPEPVVEATPQVQTGEDWEKRYKNLRASRDEKSFKTKAQLAAALETINTLQARVNELVTAAPAVDPLKDIFTEEDTDQLGEATVDAMKRVTQKVTEAATKPLQEQLARERELRQKDSEQLAKQTRQDIYGVFLSRVAKAVPDWEAINYDPEFAKFMADSDIDGMPRKTYFAEAERSGNSAQVIKYMLDYKASKANPTAPVDKLADKVTPVGDDAGATQPKSEEVKGISKAYIDKFYDDVNRGRYRGRDSEARAIEASIDAAMMKGQIVV